MHDKINQFNSLTMQSKQLERKTADAALKRAMLGREEAEAEMRRLNVLLRKFEEGLAVDKLNGFPSQHREKVIAELQARFEGTAWTGCDSWYRDRHGRIVTNWPGYMREYEAAVATLDDAEFRVLAPEPSADDGPARRLAGCQAGRAAPGRFPRSPITGR